MLDAIAKALARVDINRFCVTHLVGGDYEVFWIALTEDYLVDTYEIGLVRYRDGVTYDVWERDLCELGVCELGPSLIARYESISKAIDKATAALASRLADLTNT